MIRISPFRYGDGYGDERNDDDDEDEEEEEENDDDDDDDEDSVGEDLQIWQRGGWFGW